MTKIKVNAASSSDYDSPHDYGDAMVQGGRNGLVINSKDTSKSYRTAFVEAFIDGSFVRGEGKSLKEADDACWAKIIKQRSCSGHEFEPRSYTNGAGFCKHCGYFASEWFTGEDLGQLCAVCGDGCLEFRIHKTEKWYCSEHYPLVEYMRVYYKMIGVSDDDNFDSSEEANLFDKNYRLLRDMVFQVIDPDPDVLAFFTRYQ
jgi:hypothetical protein